MHVVVAGAAPEAAGEDFYGHLLERAAYVVAADAAAEWCAALGRMPDVAVGDFDSAAPGAADRLREAGAEVVTFPAAKDESDLDLAVRLGRERGATRLTFTAVTSLRLDHTLAAIGTAVAAADLAAEIAEPSLAAWVLSPARPALALTGPPGALVSVFALGEPARGVTIEGLRFPLRDAELAPLSSHGLSNELAAERASVAVRQGRLVVIATGCEGSRAYTVE